MKIFIDPGHGGNDPGAVGPTGLREKDVNLNIAINVRQILENHGIDARLTRSDDRRVELVERVKMANNNKVDYFVSIHINSATNSAATGTETFAFPNATVGTKLAGIIQKALVKEIGLADRGVKYNNFLVLRDTNMPSVLVEVAFINNPAEENLLKDQNFLNKAALGIAKGILEFVGIKYKEDNKVDDGISPWAREAMKWATSKEVGLTDGTMPKEPITLERLITILYRYHNLSNK